MKKWIIMQLSEKGESALEEEPKILENVIKKFISSEYFIPVYYSESKSYGNKTFLIKGYIFIEYNREEARCYPKLSSTQYFISPLLVGKRLHLVQDDEVQKLKNKLIKMVIPKISLGDKVEIIDGKYKNLKATVTEYYPKEKEADLSVNLKCMNILITKIPISCLKNVSKKKTNNNLQDKVLDALKKNPEGLTRRQIIFNTQLTENEKKRLSTCLSRATKRGAIQCTLNKNKRSVFSPLT